MRFVRSLLLGTLLVATTSFCVGAEAGRRARVANRGRSSFFLGADPHVPLAMVDRGRVRAAVPDRARGKSCGLSARWATVGSRWHVLDAWGQIVATKAVSSAEEYDVTACAELAFSPSVAADEARVLVSVDSAWRPRPPLAWSAQSTERIAFAALLAKEIPDTAVAPANVPSQCAAVSERVRFFDAGSRGRFAVGTTNTGYLVARLDGATWSSPTVVRSPATVFGKQCYRPIAVFDMNDDGMPEIVLRRSEGAAWGDFVLGVSADGVWRSIAASPGGATA